MPANIDATTLLILLIGIATAAAALLRAGCQRIGIPPLVGFLGLGITISLVNAGVTVLTPETRTGIELLGQLGLVALLFRVGLSLDPKRLLSKLPHASLIWFGNVAISGLAGYAVATWVLDLALIPSLVVAVALTATSIGVVIPIWQSAGALDDDTGALTLDVAELDDLSGIILMALLFAVLPILESGNGAFFQALAGTGLELAILFALFVASCWLFSRYGIPRLSRFLNRWEYTPERLLTVIALGGVIAGIAEMMGFSLAVGALFAGIVFSAYPERIRSDNAYGLLYDFFTPFFFISIGIRLDPALILPALGLGLVLLIPAIAGKLVGTYVPAYLMTDRISARLIAVSMVPRAEIAMVIVHEAHELGPWAVSDRLYGAMAVVALVTCLFTPPILGRMLRRWRGDQPV